MNGGRVNTWALNRSAVNVTGMNGGASTVLSGGGKNGWTVAELCRMGYGTETDYGYNLTGNFAAEGVPVPTDLRARLAGDDGKLLRVTGLKADAAFWDAVRAALKEVTVGTVDLQNYWQNTNMPGEVEMTVTGGEYMVLTGFGGQSLEKVTLHLKSGFINSMHSAFTWCTSLREFIVDGEVTANDWTSAFDHCTKLEKVSAAHWSRGMTSEAYPVMVAQMTSAFQQCPALTEVAQWGDDRIAAGNVMTPVALQNWLNVAGVTRVGPVMDMTYIDPGIRGESELALGTKLTDARIKNLNTGDWYLDGKATPGGWAHGNLSGLDDESVAYLMDNLSDLGSGTATLYAPEAWREKLTMAHIIGAKAKGWTVMIGGEALSTGPEGLMCWYNPRLQGATNESLQAKPRLTDLSGNRHDLVLYNFAFAGMSGMDGYDLPNLEDWTFNSVAGKVVVINANKLVVSGQPTNIIRTSIKSDKKLKLSVSGASADNALHVRLNRSDQQVITEDGVYDISFIYDANESNIIEFGAVGEITVEQLPLYPGALVSDGVDDRGLSNGFQLLTPDTGYTVVARLDWIGAKSGKNYVFAQKGPSMAEAGEGSFALWHTAGAKCATCFGYKNTPFDWYDNEFGVMRCSDAYHGDGADGDRLGIFNTTGTNNNYCQVAMYGFALYDHNLTDEEIEWVKANLM